MSVPPQKSRFAETAGSVPLLLTRSDVARYLGVHLNTVTWWVWALDERKRYYEFSIARKSGGEPRPIRAPIKPLKELQQSLLPLLEAGYQPKPHVHGFVCGRSPITNGVVHRGQRWILRVDLKNFFPSINFGRVRGMFLAHPFEYPRDAATLLAQICCHRNELPQGAPTSPMISNLICRRLDKEPAALGKASHCHYTRYADDICFSSGRKAFPGELASFTNDVPALSVDLRQIVASNGFVINDSKTRLMPRRQRQRVTGLIVNKRLNVPREYTRHLRAALHIWAKYGEYDARAAFERSVGSRNWPPDKAAPDFRLVIRSQLQYLGAVRGFDRVYQRLANVLARCDPSFTPSAPTWPAIGDVVYATEGPSDSRHLEAALRAYRHEGRFAELNLRPVSHKRPKNDVQLWDWLQRHKDAPNQTPQLGLFDADSGYGRELGAKGWTHLGNGVVAVALAPPAWLPERQPVCIELLYPREALQRQDVEQRRVFLREEFDGAGRTADGQYRMEFPSNTALVVSSVRRVDNERASVALGKVAFAEAVWRSQSPYEQMNFNGFEPTLERIWRAVATAQRWCS